MVEEIKFKILLFGIWWMLVVLNGVQGDDKKTLTYEHISSGEKTPDNEECKCMPEEDCAYNYGQDVIKLRLKVCENPRDVCCEPSSHEETSVPVSKEAVCGMRNVDGIGYRIMALEDSQANFAEFPWMIAVLSINDTHDVEDPKFECGGSLIHPQVVLTAAHCVDSINKSLLIARAGEYDFETTFELYPHQNRFIQEVIIHDKYHRGTALNDIALLLLDEPFDKTKNLDVICLPIQETIIDDECIVTGWGKDKDDGNLQTMLKLVEVPLVPRSQCQSTLRKTRLGPRFKLHDSFICAGGVAGKDSCEGDGGGPLICPVKGGKEMQYQQVGIVAWGVECGTEAPGVYVNVSRFYDWIKQQMNTFGLGPYLPINY